MILPKIISLQHINSKTPPKERLIINMKKLLIPYFIKNAYSAQIEGGGINFRFGYTCFGIALGNWHDKRANQYSLIQRILFPISFGFNYHSGQSNQRWLFKITILCISFGYLTKGEVTDDSWGFKASFYFPFRNPIRANYISLID